MLKIRLQRVGRKHIPSFRLVLTESENSTKSGRFHEVLGSYDPRKTNESFKIDRLIHWIDKGATPTPSVKNLLIKKGIIRGKKVDVSKKKEIVPEVTPARAESQDDTIETVSEEAKSE